VRRPLLILIGVLTAAAAVFAGSFYLTRQICVKQMANPADDLDWLRHEFRLNDAEMARIRRLHDGYLPRCGEMCLRIAAKKRELEEALAGATNVSAVAGQKLIELGELRARCQTQMLQHFVEVSQAMPPEQGRRYLAEMQRLTLGFHEQIEQSMSEPAGHEHHQP
jgi:Heavy-metal resistance